MEVITESEREQYNVAIKKQAKDLTETERKLLQKFEELEKELEKMENMSTGSHKIICTKSDHEELSDD